MFQENQGTERTVPDSTSILAVVGNLKESDMDSRLILMGRIVADRMGLANVLRNAWSGSSWDDILAFCSGTSAMVGDELYEHFAQWCEENRRVIPDDEDALAHLGRQFFDCMVGIGKAPR